MDELKRRILMRKALITSELNLPPMHIDDRHNKLFITDHRGVIKTTAEYNAFGNISGYIDIDHKGVKFEYGEASMLCGVYDYEKDEHWSISNVLIVKTTPNTRDEWEYVKGADVYEHRLADGSADVYSFIENMIFRINRDTIMNIWTFDEKLNITSVKGVSGAKLYTYDEKNNITRITTPDSGIEMEYVYTENGDIAECRISDGSIYRYTYIDTRIPTSE